MKLSPRKLVAIALCACLPFLAAADEDGEEEEQGKNVVYGLELPSEKPESAGKITLEEAQKRFKKLFELREKVEECFTDLEDIAKMEDPKKIKRKAQGALRKLDRAKKNFFKEAKKIRGKYDKPFKQLSTKKKNIERQIEQAEDRGDEKKATKLAQEIARFSSKYERLEDTITCINFYCFFEQDQQLAEALDMEIPGYGKAREVIDDGKKDDKKDKKDKKDLKDDDDDDQGKGKKKKKKKQDLDDDDDDDGQDDDEGKGRKKRRKKKSRR